MAFDMDALKWMVGDWVGKMEDDSIQETWSTPLGGTMMGTFKWMKGGGVYLYEFFAIEEAGDSVVFYLRHFDKGSIAWEDKDSPMRWQLRDYGNTHLTVETERKGAHMVMTYRREADVMTVTIDVTREGVTDSTVFEYLKVV